MPVGVGICGYTKYELPDIVQDMKDDFVADVSAALDTADDTPMGQIIGIFADRIAGLWDLGQDIYGAIDPDKAEGASQDAVCAITGTTREAASKSYVRQSVALNAGTTLTAGVIVRSSVDASIRFTLFGPWPDADIPATVGNIVASSTTTYYGKFEAETPGPIHADAGDLTVIVTPVSGWTSTTNAGDAIPGRNIEQASELRIRRENELSAIGSAPVDAIRAELLKLDGMLQVDVFENVDDVTDGDGLPPHSIECLCYDGPSPTVANNSIAQTIWAARAAGIQVYGASSGTATDAKGATHTMAFTRPTLRPIYITIDIKVNASFAGAGDTAVKDALVAKGETLLPGDDVILTSFYPSLFGIVGVVDVAVFRAGFSVTPVGTANLTIALRELATFDTARIVVNHV